MAKWSALMKRKPSTTAECCHWDWDLMIPYAVMVYRATKHSPIILTANMILFGREITEPIYLVVGLPPDSDHLPVGVAVCDLCTCVVCTLCCGNAEVGYCGVLLKVCAMCT